MEKFKPVLKFFGIFIVTNVALVVLLLFCRAMIDVLGIPVPKSAFDTVIAESFILASVIVAWKYGLINLPLEFKNGRDTLSKNALPLCAGVLWVIVMMIMQYIHVPANVDLNVDGPEDVLLIYSHLSETWFGMFMVGIGGPLTEELFFRTAVLGLMLRSGVKPWVAIVLSAFMFGIFHFGVLRLVGSGLFGLMIGYIYYKTNNILVVMIIHVFNNIFGVVLLGMAIWIFNAPNVVGISISVVFMIAFAIAGVLVMKRFCSKYPQPQFVENDEPDEPVMEGY